MISSIRTPNPVTMRKLLNYLARKKRERLQQAQSRAQQTQKSRPTAAPHN